MITKTEPTFYVRLYISGPIDQGKQILRSYCKTVGLCVTVEPTTFIYTGGEEEGYVVGLVNYPRFPAEDEEIVRKASEIAHLLLEGTYQGSILLITPSQTLWITDRP